MTPPAPPVSYFKATVAVAATLWLMIQARGVLEPLLIAVLLWFVLNALARVYARLGGAPGAEPGWIAQTLAALSGLGLIAVVGIMTANSVAGFRANLPAYEANLQGMLADLGSRLGLDGPLDISGLIQKIEVNDLLLGLAGSALGGLASLIVILVYIAFIFVEARGFPAKLAALSGADRHSELAETIDRIRAEIETYIGVKCVVGAAQAVPTFAVLWAFGVDGAAFWSVLIFVFSFVPTIGSLIGIVFPTLVAIAQFAEPGPVLGVLALLAVIQLGGSNWLEPVLMGDTLNLSPLVILVAIFAGGAIWGITGALVAVPALSVATIVFSRFESTRAVAVLLSSDGRVAH